MRMTPLSAMSGDLQQLFKLLYSLRVESEFLDHRKVTKAWQQGDDCGR